MPKTLIQSPEMVQTHLQNINPLKAAPVYISALRNERSFPVLLFVFLQKIEADLDKHISTPFKSINLKINHNSEWK